VKKNDSPDSSQREHRRDPRGVIGDLRAALGHLHDMVAPPIGKNAELGSFVRRLSDVLKKLQHVPEDEIIGALEALAGASRPAGSQLAFPPTSLESLPLAEVEAMIRDDTVSKELLLRLVRERFGASTGVLSKLRRADLVERIESFVRNERAHATVARLASGETAPSTDPPSEPKG
jgi:hypothetical protein